MWRYNECTEQEFARQGSQSRGTLANGPQVVQMSEFERQERGSLGSRNSASENGSVAKMEGYASIP